MMRFELGLEKPDSEARAHQRSIDRALTVSVAFTLLALFVFGYVKGHFTGARPFRSALQTVLVGGLAGAAAFGIARATS